ncbi:hypothetical protein MGU_05929 [Metarhizium guizhouense ARSEF 977]|uniref:Uncharacterized protein n=1 Tax=Metarhizium guizhouense (strain ARSEF 977) TaxID=1276136 RepID=A0A0B4GIA2_METGA|nr:hypothetical protein MGU_05929 [Metarhizium guizhouense ARSEF 977]
MSLPPSNFQLFNKRTAGRFFFGPLDTWHFPVQKFGLFTRFSSCAYCSAHLRAPSPRRPGRCWEEGKEKTGLLVIPRSTVIPTSEATTRKRTQHLVLRVVDIVAACYDQLFNHFGW